MNEAQNEAGETAAEPEDIIYALRVRVAELDAALTEANRRNARRKIARTETAANRNALIEIVKAKRDKWHEQAMRFTPESTPQFRWSSKADAADEIITALQAIRTEALGGGE
jgi:hypothetical protein